MNYFLVLGMTAILGMGCNRQPAQSGTQATSQATPQAAQPPATPAPAPASTAPAAPTVKPVPAELPAVVARINGDAIGKSDLDQAIQSVEQRAGRKVPPERRDQVYRDVLDQLIGYKLLLQEAKVRNITIPELDIDASIEKMKKQFTNEEDFKKALTAEGMTLDQLRQDTREGMLVSKVLDSEMTGKTPPSDQDIAAFYEKSKDRFKEGETVHASHILIKAAQNADEATKKKAREQADALLAQIKGGADFAALAKQSSQDPGSAVRGGDLGFFGKGAMPPPFENAAFALNIGEMSGVVETPFGFHIIKVTEKKPARTVPLQEVSAQIKQYLIQQQREQQANALVGQLRAKGKVEILI